MEVQHQTAYWHHLRDYPGEVAVPALVIAALLRTEGMTGLAFASSISLHLQRQSISFSFTVSGVEVKRPGAAMMILIFSGLNFGCH